MCGQVGTSVAHPVARARPRVAAGVAVDSTMPAAYTPSRAKSASDSESDTYACVALRPNGSAGLQAMSFGARRFGCRCVFDGLDGQTLVESLRPTALGGSYAIARSSVIIEGITARGADDGIVFVLALNLGESEFGILPARRNGHGTALGARGRIGVLRYRRRCDGRPSATLRPNKVRRVAVWTLPWSPTAKGAHVCPLEPAERCDSEMALPLTLSC